MAYKNHGNGDAGFALVILLAATVWAHKAFMLKVEHYALIFSITCSITVALTVLFNLFKRIRSRYLSAVSKYYTDIDSMTGLQFEHYVANLLKQNGYSNVRLTEQYDLGVDIIADRNGIRWGIQVKRHNSPVKASAIRQVVTALKFYGCEQPMVITNSYFTHVAKQLADSNDCVLIDRDTLLK